MFRPARLFLLATLVTSTAVLSGCGTIYSDMYSPKRNRFVPPAKPKPTTPELPPVDTMAPVAPDVMSAPPAPMDNSTPLVTPDAPPALPDAAPADTMTIPGL